jgi:DNA topoisomerase IA
LLPPLRNGETAQLKDPKIEDKETRPLPRYNEGTLIEAMQNGCACALPTTSPQADEGFPVTLRRL